MDLVDEGQGGLSASAHDGHDAVAGGEERDGAADRHHLARQLHARDVRRPAGWGGIEAGPLHQVRRVQPGRLHRDEQLGVARNRVVAFLPVEAAVPDHHGVHGATLGGPERAARGTGRVPGMALYDIPIHTLQGADTTLGQYKGKTLLVVNVASKCGLTPQYEGLERLQKEYGDRGFSVVGFPCNQFMGQEPGTSEEIEQFCSTTYGVTFPLMEKIDVNGEERHPIYAELTEKADAEGEAGDIKWNFEKFLLSPTGEVVARYRPQVEPEDPTIVGDIEAQLAA